MNEPINLAILLGRSERPDMAIDELWRRAQSAVAEYGVPIRCVAVYPHPPHETARPNIRDVDVVELKVAALGRIGKLMSSLAVKPGLLGIVGRLAKYNLASRRVARALEADRRLIDIFCRADVIVSADPEADRAVWLLRQRTNARLMHGPFAMANALSEVAKG